jgi:riboflavin biosynthesis pyrimidine reductase
VRSTAGALTAYGGLTKLVAMGLNQVHGSGALIRWLFDNQLVDEITLFVCPAVIGQGTRRKRPRSMR